MKRPRILLVDDTPEVLAFCAELLKTEFDIVGSVSNGKSAITAFEQTAPDVIVLDISMPGMNGIEVAKHLRRSGCQASIVFLSAQDDLLRSALEAGGSAYVSKTLVSSDLSLAIREVVAGRPFVSQTGHG